MKLHRESTVLVVIDVQERMMPPIDRGDTVVRNVEILVRGCHVLGVPVLVTEQYVRGLGPTIEPVRLALEQTLGYDPVEKICFSAHGSDAFRARLARLERSRVLLAGVETHVCVHQTGLDLLAAGFAVWVAADAVSSRTPVNREIALQRMVKDGVTLSSTEMALFEMLGEAGSETFRSVSRLVR